ncbi:hypothetical protein PV682_16525 [Streptomyces niveiscabiei]|uniref:hypothetical protein n=1 Tax=Streptomyces niveiscabiei TaxID=164115 RepID=UPI0029B63A4A|nr:hypothetical protein [Streptomyces niveiscabiei]MDX3383060.1 hypothetical protein [Streptomyces niveiscabiei]
MTNQDPHALDDLSRAWEKLHRRGTGRPDDETDRHVRDCAARLAADPTAGPAYAWTLGLVLLAPSLAQRPDSEPATAARTALTSADAALRALPCTHGTHPYRDHEEERDRDLAGRVRTLADPAQWPSYDAPRDEWACPHNIAGYARIALDLVVPGSAADVPARIPEETLDDITASPRPSTSTRPATPTRPSPARSPPWPPRTTRNGPAGCSSPTPSAGTSSPAWSATGRSSTT